MEERRKWQRRGDFLVGISCIHFYPRLNDQTKGRCLQTKEIISDIFKVCGPRCRFFKWVYDRRHKKRRATD